MFRWMRLWIGAAALLLAALCWNIAPGFAQAGVCDSALPTRLAIGSWTSVAGDSTGFAGTRVRLRAEPRITADLVEEMPNGTLARVVDGPACNDGFIWWRLSVYGSGSEGWAAESYPDMYYLIPAVTPQDMAPVPDAAAPSPATVELASMAEPPAAATEAPPLPAVTIDLMLTPGTPSAPAGDCPQDPMPSYLRVGAAVRAPHSNHPIRVWRDPSINSVVVYMAYPETELRVLAGPTCADNLRWWQVSLNGVTGWTIEAAFGRYLIVDPANAPAAVIENPSQQPTAAPVSMIASAPRPQTPPSVSRRAAYTLDGTLLAIGSNEGVRLYDAATLEAREVLVVGPVLDFVTLNGELLAVVWMSDGIGIVSLPGGQTMAAIPNGPYDPAWATVSPDGAWLILGPTSDYAPATLWNLGTGTAPAVLPFWWSPDVRFAVFTPDNEYVLIDNVFYRRSCTFVGVGCQFDLIRNDALMGNAFDEVSWSADGEIMAGSGDHFWLWDGSSVGIGWTLRSTLNPHAGRQVAVNNGATRAAVAAGITVELWNLTNYSIVQFITLPGSGQPHSLDFRPDGAQLAVAAEGGVLVYDAITGDVVRQVE